MGGMMPQWSPVMKTGNTLRYLRLPLNPVHASMEPGHEDREYTAETWHPCTLSLRLNGARS